MTFYRITQDLVPLGVGTYSGFCAMEAEIMGKVWMARFHGWKGIETASN